MTIGSSETTILTVTSEAGHSHSCLYGADLLQGSGSQVELGEDDATTGAHAGRKGGLRASAGNARDPSESSRVKVAEFRDLLNRRAGSLQDRDCSLGVTGQEEVLRERADAVESAVNLRSLHRRG